MKIYDFYYRLKKDKNAEVLHKIITANTKESAILMAKSAIGNEYKIVDIRTD